MLVAALAIACGPAPAPPTPPPPVEVPEPPPAPPTRAVDLVPLPPLHHVAHTARFGPSGTTLATVSGSGGDRSVSVWSVEEQQELDRIPINASGFDIAPDGSTVVLGRKRVATVWSVGHGAVRDLGGHWDWVEAVAVHPDGQQVFTYDDTPRFHRFELSTGRRISGPELPEVGGLLRAWALSSTHLAWASTGPGVKRWDLETGEVTELPHVPHEAGSLAATPDGRWLAATLTGGDMPGKVAGGLTIGVWDVQQGTFLEAPGPARPIALTPDGRTLVASWETRVWAIDTETGETIGEAFVDRQVGQLSIGADHVLAVAEWGGGVKLFRLVPGG